MLAMISADARRNARKTTGRMRSRAPSGVACFAEVGLARMHLVSSPAFPAFQPMHISGTLRVPLASGGMFSRLVTGSETLRGRSSEARLPGRLDWFVAR